MEVTDIPLSTVSGSAEFLALCPLVEGTSMLKCLRQDLQRSFVVILLSGKILLANGRLRKKPRRRSEVCGLRGINTLARGNGGGRIHQNDVCLNHASIRPHRVIFLRKMGNSRIPILTIKTATPLADLCISEVQKGRKILWWVLDLKRGTPLITIEGGEGGALR